MGILDKKVVLIAGTGGGVDEQNNLVAHATSTCMTLRDEQAKGR